MAVTVETETATITHAKGADWFIDDRGFLYVRDGEKAHIAAYHYRAWNNVFIEAPEKGE